MQFSSFLSWLCVWQCLEAVTTAASKKKKKTTLTDSREEKISIALRFHSSLLSLGLKRTLDIPEVSRVRRQRLTLPNDETRFLRNTCDARKTKASSEAPQRWERKTMVGGWWAGNPVWKSLPSSNLPSAWTRCPQRQHKDTSKHTMRACEGLDGG